MNRSIALLEAYPRLGEGLSTAARAEAGRDLLATEKRLSTGPWEPSTDALATELGLLLLDGLLTREVRMGPGRSVELLGEGDVLRPWQEDSASFGRVRWQVLEPARLAVLDTALSIRVCKWPPVVLVLMERVLARSRALAGHAALMSAVGIEERLQVLLWLLAEKWGSVETEGVRLEIRLPHRVLAGLIGARRPTTSAAISRLKRDGVLSETVEGSWVLHGDPPELPREESAGA